MRTIRYNIEEQGRWIHVDADLEEASEHRILKPQTSGVLVSYGGSGTIYSSSMATRGECERDLHLMVTGGRLAQATKTTSSM
jgi:hypothetical protein